MSADRTLTLKVARGSITLPAIELVVRLARHKPTTVRLGLGPVTIGTDPSVSDVVVVDERVSRKHCTVRLTDRGLRVTDLASKNGVVVNRTRIFDAIVALDDAISLADAVTLSFREVGPPEQIPLSRGASFGGALGGSPAMRALFATVERAAAADETVLLTGESGTGKEVIARGLHENSRYRKGPFVPFDCGAVSPHLIEAELFGYVRGAFTGAIGDHEGALARANGGTLFLDEIGELPIDLQPKLLRALESRTYQPVGGRGYEPFQARVVAATHRDLYAAMRERRFRDDLFYRLAVVNVRIPPLRERKEDIELLAEKFLEDLSPPRRLADMPAGALEMLEAHAWPGNVRELKNTVVRLMLFGDVEQAFEALDGVSRFGFTRALLTLPLREARDELVNGFERWYLTERLREAVGNVSRAAESIGVSRQFLHRLMAQHGIKTGKV